MYLIVEMRNLIKNSNMHGNQRFTRKRKGENFHGIAYPKEGKPPGHPAIGTVKGKDDADGAGKK